MNSLRSQDALWRVYASINRFVGFITGIFLGSIVLATFISPSWAGDQKRMDVLELFTSQGCSSCPPADVLLQQFSKRDDVLTLSFPVSYWDHLGWKDTLAKDAFNERQRNYADARGDREIYTPQLVVNGMVHAVGSQRSAIEAAMKKSASLLEKSWVPVSLSLAGGNVQLDVGDAPENGAFRSGRMWLACYSNAVTVDIGRGENNGREITYTNVVRQLLPAGSWDGRAARYDVPIPRGAAFDACAGFLQSDKSHAMLGAAKVSAPKK